MLSDFSIDEHEAVREIERAASPRWRLWPLAEDKRQLLDAFASTARPGRRCTARERGAAGVVLTASAARCDISRRLDRPAGL
jgi:hypothetical protein